MKISKKLVREILQLVLQWQLADEDEKEALEQQLYFMLIELILMVIPGDEE